MDVLLIRIQLLDVQNQGDATIVAVLLVVLPWTTQTAKQLKLVELMHVITLVWVRMQQASTSHIFVFFHLFYWGGRLKLIQQFSTLFITCENLSHSLMSAHRFWRLNIVCNKLFGNLISDPYYKPRWMHSSGGGAACRVVSSNTRDPRFESHHQQNFRSQCLSVNFIEKTKKGNGRD